jgi:hypothetical protein
MIGDDWDIPPAFMDGKYIIYSQCSGNDIGQ